MWGDDANDRVIPVIPGPRASDDAPQCCGRPMKRDGDQYRCSRCRGFYQPGRRG